MDTENVKAIRCVRCHTPWTATSGQGGTGYAYTPNGSQLCYACCAEDDKAWLRSGQPWTGYLRKQERLPGRTDSQGSYTIGNWPGTLQIDVYSVKTSSGWANGHRYPIVTFTFVFEGRRWYGRSAGDMDLARCRPYKRDPLK